MSDTKMVVTLESVKRVLQNVVAGPLLETVMRDIESFSFTAESKDVPYVHRFSTPEVIVCQDCKASFIKGANHAEVCEVQLKKDAERMTLAVALNKFVDGCQKLVDDHRTTKFPTLPRETLTTEIGHRYVRIVKSDGQHTSVYAFVDKTNGDILKPATWKAPAKHARGNIYDANPLARVTHYGPEYLR